jgi:hypothetical protein
MPEKYFTKKLQLLEFKFKKYKFKTTSVEQLQFIFFIFKSRCSYHNLILKLTLVLERDRG